MQIISLTLWLILFLKTTLGSQEHNADEKELILLLEVTRHGARTPYGSGSELINTTWPTGQGELTNSGERQHFLQGAKIRKKYIDELKFLPETFDPRQSYIRSTDYNRTIMSAYSQMLGLYPLGNGPNFDSNARRRAAVPPFELSSGASAFVSRSEVLEYNYSPFPIHVQPKGTDYMLRGYNTQLWPIIEELKEKSFDEAHEKTKDELAPLYSDMLTIWKIPADKLTLDKATPFLDAYEMSRMDNLAIDNELSDKARNLVSKYFYYAFYDGIFGNPMVAKLTATTFLNYVIDNFKAKIDAHRNSSDVSEFHKNIRHIYFSAHDTTIAGFLSAIEQQHTQKSYPPLANLNLIELYKKGNKYYLNWNVDGQYLNISNHWNAEGDWELYSTLDYFKSRTVDDLINECKHKHSGSTGEFPLWALITLVVVGLLLIAAMAGIWAYWISTKKRNDEVEEYNDEEYSNIDHTEKING